MCILINGVLRQCGVGFASCRTLISQSHSFKCLTSHFRDNVKVIRIKFSGFLTFVFESRGLLCTSYLYTQAISYVYRSILLARTLLTSIERFIEQERLYRLGQRKKAQSLTKYQRYLLDRNLPQVSVNAEVNEVTKGLIKLPYCKEKECHKN